MMLINEIQIIRNGEKMRFVVDEWNFTAKRFPNNEIPSTNSTSRGTFRRRQIAQYHLRRVRVIQHNGAYKRGNITG